MNRDRCPNGHTVTDAATYCPQCGLELDPLPGTEHTTRATRRGEPTRAAPEPDASPSAIPNEPPDPRPPTHKRTRRWAVALVAVIATATIAAGAVVATQRDSTAAIYRVRYEALGSGTAHLFYSHPDKDVEDRVMGLPATIDVAYHDKPHDARAIVFTVSETDTTRDARCRVRVNGRVVSQGSMDDVGLVTCGAMWSDFSPLIRASDARAGRSTTTTPPRRNRAPVDSRGTPRSGVYVNGPAGTPHYYIALTTQPDGEHAGTLGFLYQNGQTTTLFNFAGRPESGVLILSTAPDGGDFSVTYGPDQLHLGQCDDYLQYVQTLAECTFTYSPGGIAGD